MGQKRVTFHGTLEKKATTIALDPEDDRLPSPLGAGTRGLVQNSSDSTLPWCSVLEQYRRHSKPRLKRPLPSRSPSFSRQGRERLVEHLVRAQLRRQDALHHEPLDERMQHTHKHVG